MHDGWHESARNEDKDFYYLAQNHHTPHLEITNQPTRPLMAKQTAVPAPLPLELTTEHVRVVEVRGDRVALDHDVAALFGVETRQLNQQVTRNKGRFGEDFAFRLTKDEVEILRSQNVISSSEWGGTRYQPMAFTEHGVVMAATVLKTPQAIAAMRMIVTTFVQARKEAWEREAAKKLGNQFQLALDIPTRQGLATKLQMALGQVLDAIIDPTDSKKVPDHAREIATEGLKALKEYLKKAGINNEKTLAEVRQIMAEAESIEVETAKKKTEHQHRQLALMAKKLRLVIQAQHYAETGSIEGLMVVLADLEKP